MFRKTLVGVGVGGRRVARTVGVDREAVSVVDPLPKIPTAQQKSMTIKSKLNGLSLVALGLRLLFMVPPIRFSDF